MKFHEFGCKNDKILLMFHGSCMTWYMYEKSIKIMAEKVHVIIPAITGHDLSIKEDFTSVEEVARETENWLFDRGYDKIDCLYKALRHYNAKSIWRVFESCNNYSMPNPVPMLDTNIEYWYGEREEKDRVWDINYVKKIWSGVRLRKIMDAGHGEYCLRFPDKFAADILKRLENKIN